MKCSSWHQRCVYSGTGTATGLDKPRNLNLCFWKLFLVSGRILELSLLFYIQIAFLLLFFLWLTWVLKYSGTKGGKVGQRTCDKATAEIQRKQGWIQPAGQCACIKGQSIQEPPPAATESWSAWDGGDTQQTPFLAQACHQNCYKPSCVCPSPAEECHGQNREFHSARQTQLNCQNQHWIIAWAAIKLEQCRYPEPAFNHPPSPVLIS